MKEDILKGIFGAFWGLCIGVLGFFLCWYGLVWTLLDFHLILPWQEDLYILLFAIASSMLVGFKTFFEGTSGWLVSILKMLGTSVLVNVVSFLLGLVIGLIMNVINGEFALGVVITLIVVLVGVPVIRIIFWLAK